MSGHPILELCRLNSVLLICKLFLTNMESGLGLVELEGNIDMKRIAIYSFSKLIFFTLSHKAVILIFASNFFDYVNFH